MAVSRRQWSQHSESQEIEDPSKGVDCQAPTVEPLEPEDLSAQRLKRREVLGGREHRTDKLQINDGHDLSSEFSGRHAAYLPQQVLMCLLVVREDYFINTDKPLGVGRQHSPSPFVVGARSQLALNLTGLFLGEMRVPDDKPTPRGGTRPLCQTLAGDRSHPIEKNSLASHVRVSEVFEALERAREFGAGKTHPFLKILLERRDQSPPGAVIQSLAGEPHHQFPATSESLVREVRGAHVGDSVGALKERDLPMELGDPASAHCDVRKRLEQGHHIGTRAPWNAHEQAHLRVGRQRCGESSRAANIHEPRRDPDARCLLAVLLERPTPGRNRKLAEHASWHPRKRTPSKNRGCMATDCDCRLLNIRLAPSSVIRRACSRKLGLRCFHSQLVLRMSVDKMMREMVASEVARALEPVNAAIAELRNNSALVGRLALALGQPIKRGPGRPSQKTSQAGARRPKRGGQKSSSTKRECAVIGCGKRTLSRGYCAAHYQKFRMLDRTGRRPSDWVPDAAPASVQNIVLPRGRHAG